MNSAKSSSADTLCNVVVSFERERHTHKRERERERERELLFIENCTQVDKGKGTSHI